MTYLWTHINGKKFWYILVLKVTEKAFLYHMSKNYRIDPMTLTRIDDGAKIIKVTINPEQFGLKMVYEDSAFRTYGIK